MDIFLGYLKHSANYCYICPEELCEPYSNCLISAFVKNNNYNNKILKKHLLAALKSDMISSVVII